jgi:hypothetical protein
MQNVGSENLWKFIFYGDGRVQCEDSPNIKIDLENKDCEEVNRTENCLRTFVAAVM